MTTLDILTPPPCRLLHPAFDMRDALISFGFSVGRNGARITLHVVSDGERVAAFDSGAYRYGTTDLRYPPSRPELLADVAAQWGRERLRAFLKAPRAPRGEDLYERLIAAWRRHVEFDHRGKDVMVVCWGLMTYVYPVFRSLPFLHFLGPKGTGKSQALDLLAQLTRDGYKSRATAAVVGDLIQSRRVTLLFDQAGILSPEHTDIFADSYRVGAQRTIVNMDRRGEPDVFETFGPKAFAGTAPLPEDLADRTILITTTPAARNLEPVEPDDPELAELRARSYEWAALNFWTLPPIFEMLRQSGETALLRDEYPALQAYQGRQRDLLLPIEAIMEVVRVPDEDRDAARDYYARSQSSTKAELPEDDVRLITLLAERVGEQSTVQVTSDELLRLLNAQDDAEFDPDAGWSPKKLGRRLKSLGLLRREPRRLDRNQRRAYLIDGDAVRSLAKRYGLTE